VKNGRLSILGTGLARMTDREMFMKFVICSLDDLFHCGIRNGGDVRKNGGRGDEGRQ
jgi:hypothetical protein